MVKKLFFMDFNKFNKIKIQKGKHKIKKRNVYGTASELYNDC